MKITATTTKYNDNDTRGKNGKLQGAEKDVRSLENVFSKYIYTYIRTHTCTHAHIHWYVKSKEDVFANNGKKGKVKKKTNKKKQGKTANYQKDEREMKKKGKEEEN